jgi:hypothetical protein
MIYKSILGLHADSDLKKEWEELQVQIDRGHPRQKYEAGEGGPRKFQRPYQCSS